MASTYLLQYFDNILNMRTTNCQAKAKSAVIWGWRLKFSESKVNPATIKTLKYPTTTTYFDFERPKSATTSSFLKTTLVSSWAQCSMAREMFKKSDVNTK